MIPAGHAAEQRTIVTADLTSDYGGAPILATPHLLALLERLARQSVRPFLAEGEDSVGAAVALRHRAPAPLGTRIRLTVRVTAVDGRRIRFTLEASGPTGRLAEGEHERVIIDLRRFTARLAST